MHFKAYPFNKLTNMKYKLSIISLSLSLVFLASCEKEKNYLDNASAGSPNEVGYGLPAGSAFILNVDASTTILDTTINVFLSSKSGNSGNVGVSVAPDTATLNAYNDANATEFDTIPSEVYTYPTSVSIPAGSKTGEAHLKVDIQKLLTYGTSFGMGFKITKVDASGVSVQSANNSVVVIIRVKNQYDGSYVSNGYLYHPASPRSIDKLAKTGTTAGPNSITMPLGDLGGSGYVALFTINSDNTVTIAPAPGAAGGTYYMFSSGLPTTNPGYTAAWSGSSKCNNTYNPDTKTFYVRYGYLGGTGYRVTEEIIQRQ